MTGARAGEVGGAGGGSGIEPGPGLRRRRLGAELRRLREARSLRLEDVAAKLEVAASTLSRIETGKAPARTWYVNLMLDMYGVEDDGLRRRLVDLAREGQRRAWWVGCDDLLPAGTGEYLSLEAGAAEVCCYSAQMVPDLLQTDEYALAAYQARRGDLAPGQISELAGVQARRRQLLVDGVRKLHFLVDESVLLRSVGSEAVMAGQLEHLGAMAGHPSVTMQVVEMAKVRPRISGSFTVLRFGEREDSPVVCSGEFGGPLVFAKRESDVRTVEETFAALADAGLSPGLSASLIASVVERGDEALSGGATQDPRGTDVGEESGGARSENSADEVGWEVRVGPHGVLTATMIGSSPPFTVSAPDMDSLRKKIRKLIFSAMM